jgi:acylphosphatase
MKLESFPVVARRFKVRGCVQGVGFRAATVDVARRLKLTGWVRNRTDGTVEVLACGNEEGLLALEAWLRQGPRGARVDDLESVAVEDGKSGEHETFVMAPTE